MATWSYNGGEWRSRTFVSQCDSQSLASLHISALSTLRWYEWLDSNQLSHYDNGFTDHHDSPSSSHSRGGNSMIWTSILCWTSGRSAIVLLFISQWPFAQNKKARSPTTGPSTNNQQKPIIYVTPRSVPVCTSPLQKLNWSWMIGFNFRILTRIFNLVRGFRKIDMDNGKLTFWQIKNPAISCGACILLN